MTNDRPQLQRRSQIADLLRVLAVANERRSQYEPERSNGYAECLNDLVVGLNLVEHMDVPQKVPLVDIATNS